MAADPGSRCFDAAVLTRGRRGEPVSGDLAMLIPAHGSVLVAAIDGLGHGPHAALVARRAGAVVSQVAQRRAGDVIAVMRACHLALRGTRGAAITLASLTRASSTMSWLGIGNVEGRVIGGEHSGPLDPESLRLLPGVVGHDLPALTLARLQLRRGDLVAFASDGVASDFADDLDATGRPIAVAERILADHWSGRDDAVVVVLRWLASRPTGLA